ncbi:Uncharacterised protein, partial [Mycoplasmopsis edwardii]
MIRNLKDESNKMQLLKPAFEGHEFPSFVGRKNAKVTDNLESEVSYVYLDKEHQTW